MLGFEAALFVPTGTQSNLCAILSHCQRGDEYIVGQMQHCYRWEGGGAAVFGSVQPQPLDHQTDGTPGAGRHRGRRSSPTIRISRAPGCWRWRTRWAASCCRSPTSSRPPQLAQRKGLARHLDGARLFNAAVAQAARTGGDRARRSAAHRPCFDSVSVCFSKGLGAPVGSALCGSRELIARARRIRKMAGGACGRPACWPPRPPMRWITMSTGWREDHALAQRLAEGLGGHRGLQVEAPQTNILFVDLVGPARERVRRHCSSTWQSQGVLATGLYRLRFVTHLDVDAAGVDRAIAAIRQILRQLSPPCPIRSTADLALTDNPHA